MKKYHICFSSFLLHVLLLISMIYLPIVSQVHQNDTRLDSNCYLTTNLIVFFTISLQSTLESFDLNIMSLEIAIPGIDC